MFNRFDLYGQVHKGIRLALSGMCQQAGSIDASEEERVRSFIEEFGRIVIILEAHSHDEDAHLNESYEKYAPETLRELEDEHEGLERELGKLVGLVDKLSSSQPGSTERRELWYRVGKDLNRFTAHYFIHLQREEGPGMTALWNNLTDDELKVLSINIRSSIPPQTMAIFMHYMLPSISHEERAEMLGEMKQFAPVEAYAGMLALAQSRLDSNSWNKLQTTLQAV